jgi:hypothetical protein
MGRGEYVGYFMINECGGQYWHLWKAPSGDLVGVPEYEFQEGQYPILTVRDPVSGSQFLIQLPPNYWDDLLKNKKEG